MRTTSAVARTQSIRMCSSLPSNLVIEDPKVFEPELKQFEELVVVEKTGPKEVPVYALSNASAPMDEITLDDFVFGAPFRPDILHRVVRWQRAKRRAGTACVKTRAEVRGGGKKPRPQKGSGRSRAGSIRSPLWRGGGKAHGPRPRDWSHSLPKKVRALGLRVALSVKFREGRLRVIGNTELEAPKTKLMAQLAQDHGMDRGATMIVGDERDEPLLRASGNLHYLKVMPQRGANVYDILKREQLVLTTDAIAQLTARLKLE